MIQNKALRTTLGWRECISLPELGVSQIKVKVDTGAKNSSLHVSNINLLKKNSEEWLSFDIHLDQNKITTKRFCMARSMGRRWVTNSGGKREKRFVIETPIRIGDKEWPIIITLSKREQMKFRMLLGRTAITGKYVVDPSRSFCCKLI
jgi:hypothetical protein